MAYIFDPNQEDEQQSNTVSGENTTVTSDTVNKNPSSKSGSGSFTNLSNYLEANKGQRFGDRVAGKVEGVANEADQTTQDSSQQFRQRADQGAVQYDSDLAGRAANDSANFVTNQGDVDKFKKMRDAQYGGPNSFADASDLYTQTQQKVDKAQQVGKAAQNESGRFALLDQFFKRPDYGRGQKSLDNLLIQNDPNARPRIEAAAQQGLSAKDRMAQAVQANNEYAQRRLADTAATKQQIQNQFMGEQGAFPLLQQQLNQRALDAKMQQQQQYDAYLSGLGGPGLRAEQYAQLGIDPSKATFNVDPRTLLNQRTAPTVQQVTTQPEAQRFAALAQLLDQENTLGTQVGGYDPSQAITFDQQGYQDRRSANEAAYNDAIKNARYIGHGNTDMQINDALKSYQSWADQLRALGLDYGSNLSDFNTANEQIRKINDILGGLKTQYGANKFLPTLNG